MKSRFSSAAPPLSTTREDFSNPSCDDPMTRANRWGGA